MATVTFPDDLGGDGLTVTDDANPDTGLAAGGHRLRFVPALNNTVAMARTAADQAAAAKQLADQTAADREQTGKDRDAIAGAKEATAADRVQTGKDANAASDSQAAAANSQSAAKTSETNAAKSASAAKSSESGAVSAKQSATDAASAAEDSATEAKNSETASASSQSAANTSATKAANSAAAASASERAAADSANDAAASAASVDADQIMHKRGSGLVNEVGTAATRDVGELLGQILQVGEFGLGIPIELTEKDDLNDIKTPGDHVCHADKTTSRSRNYPIETAGVLITRGGTSSNRIRTQIYISYPKYSRIYHRTGYQDNWYEWSEIYTSRFDTGWLTPTLLNGWENYGLGYSSVQFRKDAHGFVHIKGLLRRREDAGFATIIFVLPSGFRPAEKTIAIGRKSWEANSDNVRIDVREDGNVWISSDGHQGSEESGFSWASLDSVVPFEGV